MKDDNSALAIYQSPLSTGSPRPARVEARKEFHAVCFFSCRQRLTTWMAVRTHCHPPVCTPPSIYPLIPTHPITSTPRFDDYCIISPHGLVVIERGYADPSPSPPPLRPRVRTQQIPPPLSKSPFSTGAFRIPRLTSRGKSFLYFLLFPPFPPALGGEVNACLPVP